MKQYNYEWTTPEDIISNRHKTLKFRGWGTATLVKIAGVDNPEIFKKAHELWLKLKDAFNAEAKGYVENNYLGSIGPVGEREVMRSAWWNTLDGDAYGDYDILTSIIETLHGGEKLETGVILFGS